MNRDWINEAKTIADELRIAGFEDEPHRIIEAIESGSTGGEILMALRWNMEEMLKNNSSFEHDLKNRMKEIRKGIADILGG